MRGLGQVFLFGPDLQGCRSWVFLFGSLLGLLRITGNLVSACFAGLQISICRGRWLTSQLQCMMGLLNMEKLAHAFADHVARVFICIICYDVFSEYRLSFLLFFFKLRLQLLHRPLHDVCGHTRDIAGKRDILHIYTRHSGLHDSIFVRVASPCGQSLDKNLPWSN